LVSSLVRGSNFFPLLNTFWTSDRGAILGIFVAAMIASLNLPSVANFLAYPIRQSFRSPWAFWEKIGKTNFPAFRNTLVVCLYSKSSSLGIEYRCRVRRLQLEWWQYLPQGVAKGFIGLTHWRKINENPSHWLYWCRYVGTNPYALPLCLSSSNFMILATQQLSFTQTSDSQLLSLCSLEPASDLQRDNLFFTNWICHLTASILNQCASSRFSTGSVPVITNVLPLSNCSCTICGFHPWCQL